MTDERPRPRYGEYAPVEPPAPPSAAPPAAPAAPTESSSAPALGTPESTAARASQPAAPAFGPPAPEQRLDGGPAPARSVDSTTPARAVGAPDSATTRPVGAPESATTNRPRWDAPVTVALLVLGVYDVVTSWRELADLAGVVGQVYAQQGIGDYTALGAAATIGLVANVARVVLLVIVLAVSLARIRERRRAFLVPLIGGAIGAVILFVAIVAAMLVDPAFIDFVASQTPA